MDKSLALRVITALQDKLAGPLSKIKGEAAASGKEMAALRDRLRALNATQRDVGEFRNLSAGLRTTRGDLAAAQQRVAQLGRQIQETQNPTRQMRREFDRAVATAGRLKDAAAQQSARLQELRNRLSSVGVSTSSLATHERELRQNIGQANQALERQAARLKAVARQQERLQSARASYDRGKALAGNMVGFGVGGVAAGGGALYAAERTLAPGLDFDASMSKVQALARLDKASADMKALRAQARQLGAATQFTAGQAADAQGFLAMAGFAPAAIRAAMPGMLSLAKAGDSDLAQTADIASNILTGFNLQASDMGRVGDVLVGAFTRSNTNLQMLGDTMKYVAPVAAGVGQDIETVAAMAGKLGDAGIQGSMGGTALRAILARLASPPKMAADALAQLGVSAKDAQGKMRDLPTVLQEIYAKTKDMGNAQRAGVFKDIAGEEAFSGLQVLVNQAGNGALQQFVATLRKTAGEADTTAAVMANNLRGDLAQLTSAWEDLGIQIEEQQDGPLRGMTQALSSIVSGIKGWIAENPVLAGALLKGAAAVAALVAGLGALTLALGSVLGPFVLVRYGMTLFGLQGASLIGTLMSLARNVFPLVSSGIMLIGRALLANPIGLAVTAIGTAALLIYQYWEPIKAFFAGLWDSVKQAFAGGLAGVGALLADWSPVGLLYRAISAGLSALGVELPAKFSEFGSMLIQGLINGITSMGGAVKDTITNLGGGMVDWFKEKLGIRSPSRVFMAQGEFVSQGAAAGIRNAQPAAIRAAQALAASVAIGGALAPVSPVLADSGTSGGVIAAQEGGPFDTRPALPPVQARHVIVQGDTIQITISPAAGMSADDIGRAVQDALRRRDREKAARVRSTYRDDV